MFKKLADRLMAGERLAWGGNAAKKEVLETLTAANILYAIADIR